MVFNRWNQTRLDDEILVISFDRLSEENKDNVNGKCKISRIECIDEEKVIFEDGKETSIGQLIGEIAFDKNRYVVNMESIKPYFNG